MRLAAFTQGLRFGGDDAVLLALVQAWPDGDRWSVFLNRTHGGLDAYRVGLAGRADVHAVDLRGDEEPGAPDFVPAVLTLRRAFQADRPDALLVSSGGFPPTTLTMAALCAARLARVPRVVLALHADPNMGSGLRSLWRRGRGLLAARMADVVVSVSADCAAKISAACGRPVRMIANGMPDRTASEDAAALRQELGVPPEVPLIGAIGHLDPRKGFQILFDAFRRISERRTDAHLVVIGAPADQDEAAALRRLAADPRLGGRARLAGERPNAWRFASAFDVVAAPSLERESFGLMALDAMRAGKPVIASRVGGLPEVVSDGETGFVVPPGDAAALAEALERLLAAPELARRMGEAGRRRAAERFSAARMAREYAEVLR